MFRRRLEDAWRVCNVCLEGVLNVSGRCPEVSGRRMEGVSKVSRGRSSEQIPKNVLEYSLTKKFSDLKFFRTIIFFYQSLSN